MAENSSSNQWADKLLELNKQKNLKSSEIYDLITDLEIHCKVGKEQVNHLKSDIEKKEIEYKYKLELLDTLRERNELFYNCREKSEELIKYKKLTNNLKNDVYDLEKQKWLEREKQEDILERQWNKVCEEQMKLLENDPSVKKLNELRRDKAILKFKIAVLKQNVQERQKQQIQFDKIQKQIHQRNIIKFAEIMVEYYKNQKKKDTIKQNKNHECKMPQTKIETSKLNINSETKRLTENTKKNETIALNKIPLQLPSLSFLNNTFDMKKYTSTISKPEMNKKIPETMISNINVPKTNFLSTLSKLKINKFLNPQQENKIVQNAQQVQKKIPETVKLNPKKNDIPILEKTQQNQKQENKNSLQAATIQKSVVSTPKKISLSQSNEKEIHQNNIRSLKQTKILNSSQDFSQNKNQIFSFLSPKPKINEIPKPASLDQMFTKKVENSSQKQVTNQMFCLPTGTTQPMEIVPETPKFSKPTKALETKSPYFPTQSSSSQNDPSSLNTSTTENSDQIVNVSSDQHSSQISGDEFNPNNVEMQEDIQRDMMEYEDADRYVPYPEENASVTSEVTREDQFYILPGYTSPPEGSEHELGGQNSNISIPESNNLFTSNQNSNNFLNFGQSNNSKSGSIFNLF